MNSHILISVIVPVYNVEQYLARCVDSLLVQTHRNLEIILVDDGTKDSSGVLCDAYAQKDPRVRVIHKENGGLSSARNAGIDVAQGEYFAFLDSDDWVEPNAYSNMLALAEKHGVKLVCAGRYDVSSATGAKKRGLCPIKEEVISGEELVRRIFTWDNVDSAAWDKLYHRSLFREIRYPLGVICEDVPTTYRIALDAGQAAMCNQPVYNYYHRPGSITTSSVSAKTFHLAQHTKGILEHVSREYPALEPAARYLRIRSLAYSVLCVDIAGREDRKRFAREGKLHRRQLRQFLPDLLTCPMLGRQERLTDILLSLGLYRCFRAVYHRIKGS